MKKSFKCHIVIQFEGHVDPCFLGFNSQYSNWQFDSQLFMCPYFDL